MVHAQHIPQPQSAARVRNGLIVFGTCIAISVVVGVLLFARYRRDLPETQDVVTGLLYFIELNGGRFPASEAEFCGAPFVENLPEGGLRIRPRPDSAYRGETHGAVIRDLRPFEIRWGADLSAMSMNERSRVVDASGREVSLVRWPSSPTSGRVYSPMLFRASERARQRAAEAVPSTAYPPPSATRDAANEK